MSAKKIAAAATELFVSYAILYIALTILEDFLPGFVSDYFDITYLLAVLFVLGLVLVFTQKPANIYRSFRK